MKCATSVLYSVLVNGSPCGTITPTRGLRQGDPLSPYLFLLCGEGLSSLLANTENVGGIFGVPISTTGPKISHLFFADYGLIFCRATFQEWVNLMHLIQVYERASGQKINNSKTAIFISNNTRMEFRDFICSSMGIAQTACYETYLGLPTLVGR